jgi:hypothetical protein
MRLPRRPTKERLASSQSGCVTIPFVHQEKLESGGHSTFIFSFWLSIPNITVKY